ncbi:hypothetical protein ACFLIM_48030 [Nonomuraea sp. M3C6]|uniref:Helix-turn-helix domain-containing protein n=1 Tax=Nonomuraea marmarensis TaxID=3351344 RepID=A0ABW7AX36_9ACTN
MPGEPQPLYDPQRTTLTERRRAKVAELAALNRDDAKALRLERVSERTLERMTAQRDERGLMGLADGRWTPRLRELPIIEGTLIRLTVDPPAR